MIDGIAAHLGTLEAVVSTEVQGTKVIAVVAINNENFTLVIDFGANFPVELPEIHLSDPSSYGFLPHVCWQGKVCYNDGEGVSIDTTQPADIAEYVITKAIEVLSIEKNKREGLFFNEFEGYWNRQGLARTAYSFFEPDDRLQILKASVLKKKKIPVVFFPDNNDVLIEREYQFSKLCKSNKTQMNAVYLPLDKCVNPPLPGEPLNISFLNDILQALSSNNKALWDTTVSKGKLPKDALHLLISQPRPIGGKSLYGITIPYGLNWLNGKIESYNHQIVPLDIKRHTPDYLIERSGGQINIADKQVVIIGCGSVGSRIAELLIMSGIKKLTLIDSDNFSSDNLFRHILDSCYIGQKKVESLAEQLKSRFPYISIATRSEKVTKLTDFLTNHDVIIDATGNPTLGRELNISCCNMNGEHIPLLLTVWTEPLGLGGHAVLSDGRTNGCLHCLFHRDNSAQLSSIFNFVEENQVVSRNLTGCGGAFTPFSALDAVKTAEMATRMAIDTLAHINAEYKNINKYQWWRGKNKAAIKANIKTTSWYDDCEQDINNQISAVFREGCPVCRKK